MRKLMFLFMALLLPLSAIEMRADEEKAEIKIPIHKSGGKLLGRTLIEIDACYYGMMSCIQTSVYSDLGEVEVSVTNCSTGEMWYDTFDSGEESYTFLYISGSAGLYEITYTTESGDVYEGSFMIE